jgi:hypothetical protein
VDAWIDELATALGEEPVDAREAGAILKLARDVAHGVERKLAPLSTYLAGIHVGRRMAEGSSREQPLAEVLDASRALIPAQPEPG